MHIFVLKKNYKTNKSFSRVTKDKIYESVLSPWLTGRERTQAAKAPAAPSPGASRRRGALSPSWGSGPSVPR